MSSPESTRIRVIKLGGSLLELADWKDRFTNWIDVQLTAQNCLVVGGGPLVDAIRHMPAVAEYDDAFLHWLCLDLMHISSRLVEYQLDTWSIVNHWHELQQRLAAGVSRTLVNVRAYYSAQTEAGLEHRLPLNWDTTSDSLAALLARLVKADELVLLKSCGPAEHRVEVGPNSVELQRLAEQGIIDRAMPEVCRSLRLVRLVNLKVITDSSGFS